MLSLIFNDVFDWFDKVFGKRRTMPVYPTSAPTPTALIKKDPVQRTIRGYIINQKSSVGGNVILFPDMFPEFRHASVIKALKSLEAKREISRVIDPLGEQGFYFVAKDDHPDKPVDNQPAVV